MILVIFCEIKEGCFEKVSMASSLVSRKTDAFPPKQKRSEERIIAVLFSSFLLSQPRLYRRLSYRVVIIATPLIVSKQRQLFSNATE